MAQRARSALSARFTQGHPIESSANAAGAGPVHRGSRAGEALPGAHDCLRCEVRHLALCAALREEELPHLEAVFSTISAAPGQTLFHEGDPIRHVYNIAAGALRLFRVLPDGRRQIIGFGLAGDFIGLWVEGKHPYGAEAVNRATLCQFPLRRLNELFLRFPGMERRLLEIRAMELLAAQDRMVLLGRMTPMEKIASFLLEISARQERCGQPASPVILLMTRGDIADYLGLTVETVSRCFTRLRGDRFIALPEPTSVALLNRERLQDLAFGN